MRPREPETSPAERRDLRYDWLLLTALILVYGVVQWLFWRPPILSDQLDYFRSAADLPDVRPSHRHLRLGLLLPTRLLVEIAGYSEIAYYTVPILSVVALIAGTYLLGRLVGGRWVAAASAALVALNPYVLNVSSFLLPDIPAAALLLWGLLCIVWVGHKGHDLSGKGGVLLFLSGLLLGWSYLTREFIPLLFFLIPTLFVRYRLSWKGLLPIAAGITPMVLVELIYGQLVYGDWLVRLNRSAGPRSTDFRYATEPLDIATSLPRIFLRDSGGIVWVFLLLMACALPWLARTRSREIRLTSWFITAWVFGFWTFLTVVGLLPFVGVFDDGFVLLRLHLFRYWTPIVPALVVAGVTATFFVLRGDRTSESRWRHLPGVAVAGIAGVAITLGVSGIWDLDGFTRTTGGQYLEFRDYLRRSSADSIWLSAGDGRAASLVVPIYAREWYGEKIWDGEFLPLNDRESWMEPALIETGAVLIYPHSFEWMNTFRDPYEWMNAGHSPVPSSLSDWPDEWTPLFVSRLGQMGLLSVEGGGSSQEVSSFGERWLAIESADLEYDSDRLITRVRRGDGLVLVDGRAPALDAPPNDLDSTDYSIVMGSVHLTLEGAGSVGISCLFFEPGGEPWVVPALFFVGGATEVIDFACRKPSDLAASSVRTMLVLNGPLVIEISPDDHLTWWNPEGLP